MDFTSRLKIYQTRCKKEDKESMCWNKNTCDFLVICHCSFVIFHLTFVIINFSVPNCHLSSPKMLFIIFYGMNVGLKGHR